MKIIKVASKKVGDAKYYKYILNLPKKLVEESGFTNKDLFAEIKNRKIIISLKE